ncbi:NAD(P)/FAD-dependent oxidoreductase [Rhodospirillum rubrum]|uniref:FAD dependent oxidoreductase n=1 Tax=Rhodospirillum rubrum (strain ATCC 11170 / ATH 1.1.1 / DSM 467 / LMG 4362 / NCIMB 8255 / S1) TaxID=269796 RepID=Q2RQC4_RHORT|nr:FAD-dependent oxidoreductase [Rhodospirillum rubrum]ABC23671.1 FAD dependent oxidoreductase [Rhodospirillum rubrum ATCC 11170]MBK5955347.1 FAD-binding oxidoreductase [Rhodospirillum rubrum]QXG79631.1 FAD-binding oxidoreductase [Rhodospirillum rubrum]HAP98688.1 FAD-binding oxidoreductase [Rhodospirillum rubrum]HCF17796.1 FAD-binding oxidoreductase [Rhodospirillum rubrum]
MSGSSPTPASPSSTPPSLWAATAPSAPPTRTLAGETRADLAVIGAGVTGLSTALHAAEAGLTVTVVEAEEAGFGGSGRNNGQVIPTLAKPDPSDLVAKWGEAGERLARMVGESAALVFDLIDRHAIACEAVQHGWLQPAHRPSRLTVSQKRHREWTARGLDCRLVDRAETAALTGSDYWAGGLLCPTGGHVTPLALTRGLARAAQKAGATVYTASPVTGIDRRGSDWRVATPGGAVTARAVVIATSAYGQGVWPTLERSIVPVRNFQMSTQPLPPEVLAKVIPADVAISDTHGDLYFFRKTADGRLVSGCTLTSRTSDPTEAKARVIARILEVFPQAGRQTIDYCWHGQLDFTPDFHPRFYSLEPGIFAAIGYNGRGLALGVAVGRELARAAAGTPFSQLALPDGGKPRPLPFHGLITGVAPLMMHWWRHKDGRD